MVFGVLLTPHRTLALDNSKALHQLNCRTWTRQTGLPVNGIRSIAQTRDGHLWLATQKGLVRFDGFDFKVSEPPIHEQWLSRIPIGLQAHDGDLWFAMEAGRLGSWNPQLGFVAPQGQDWIKQASLTGLFKASDGALWIGHTAGTVRWVPGTTNVTFYDQVWAGISFCEDGQKRVWIGTADRGLFRWDKERLEPFVDPELTNQSIFSLAVDAQSNLWVGTQLGLRSYNAELRPNPPSGIYAEVRALHADRNGALWIGTSGDGLGRLFNGKYQFLTRTNGLANDYIRAIVEDREGSLWLGTRDGLSQLTDIKFPTFGPEDGLLPGNAHAVSAGRNGGVWVTSSRGLSWFNERGEVRTYSDATAGFRSSYLKRVIEARNGDVYVINAQREIEVMAGGQVIARHSFAAWPTALAEDSQGVLASVGADLFRINRTELTRITFGGRTPDFYWIRNLSVCPDDTVLVATVNGTFRVRGDQVLGHWNVDDGLLENDVFQACEDSEKNIWVAQPRGLALIRNGKAFVFTDKLTDASIHSLAPDHRGNLWLQTSKGLACINRNSALAVADRRAPNVVGTLFEDMESLKTIDLTELEYVNTRTSDGKLWFATPTGALRIDPDNVPLNRTAPPVEILSIRVNGMAVDLKRRTNVPPGRGELAVQFTALSLTAPHKIQFRYKLEGYDTDWVEAGARRTAVYANLKPKTYTFRVQACNADGFWNETGASAQVYLPPHYYQTAWFQLLAVALTVSTLAGIYTWRVAHLRRKQRRLQAANELLESRILERTQELSEQRNLLRTLIDHLPDDVFVKDKEGRVIINNLAHARTMGVDDPQLAIGKTDFDCYPAEQAEAFRETEQALLASGRPYNAEESVLLKNGARRWQRTTKVPLRDSHGQIIGLAGIQHDITARKDSEAQLELLNRQLVTSSRQAGMAEVATSVLHNVGNVLNSVNISASIVEEQTRRSGIDRLQRAVQLLRENEAHLAEFLTADDKGRKVIHYLETLHRSMEKEHARVLEEIQLLTRNVEHIKKIVAMQQSYARVSGVVESVTPAELLEDAFRMHEAAYQRHSIRVVRLYQTVPTLSVDRHKAIQILVNLLQNAKYACDVNDAANRVVTLKIAPSADDRVEITVTDNGMGIPAENLTRIFSYGFTTRKNGHGFGLHSGALAAKEMGGSLSVHSDGPGKGASFALELPAEPKCSASTRHLEANPVEAS